MKGKELEVRFAHDRPHLRAVAYRLLGSLDDADDALQQAWLKAARADLSDVHNLTGWLTTVTARECLDLLRARRRRAEVALPAEPPAAPSPDEAVLAERVGLALLVVLDRLSPDQRVAFVLHDLFSVPFGDIARVLRKSPDAAKKLASRARERVNGGDPAAVRADAATWRLAEAFLAASRSGDIPALLELLAPEVVRRADPALLPPGVPALVHGARAVAEETRAFAARTRAAQVALVDGAPGLVVAPGGRLLAVLRLTVEGGRITAVDVVAGRRVPIAVDRMRP
ncbi:sigma-70 family RNA polymerase sigma factor [Dactylosporangium sp. NPDC000555]|uniref:sigma-70 family RNA polymerase sigma factor n=1 Tax=Dactylosporangium sp. NPDC000555 TaxID=3154260 RepID=UPI003331F835